MIGVRWTCRKKRKRNKGGMKKAGRLWCGKEEKNMEDPNQEKKGILSRISYYVTMPENWEVTLFNVY